MKNLSLTRWFQRQKSNNNTGAGKPVKNYANVSILIVDDSRTQLYAMERMLQSVGIKTVTAENGKQGILMARHKKPDLILMDIVMPEINGFQATRYLTRQPDTCHIPIIIISGSDQECDKAWGLKLGAREYMSKPVEKTELLAKIDALLSAAPKARPMPAEHQVESILQAV
jgi:twitching motility two-component system response regulator PilH